LYSSNIVYIIKEDEMLGAYNIYAGEMRMTYRLLVRNPERTSLSDRPRCQQEVIKMNIKETDVEWINLAQNRDQ
jgi:hypothetical protein